MVKDSGVNGMEEQYPLVYIEWDENKQIDSEPLAKVLVNQGILFLRKLVNATVIQNRIWEHSSHESEEDQSTIYVKPYVPGDHDKGKELEKTVFTYHEISPQYEAEFWEEDRFGYHRLQKRCCHQALDAAQLLLDHYLHLNGIHYEIQYAILDPARKKVLLFLQRTTFNT